MVHKKYLLDIIPLLSEGIKKNKSHTITVSLGKALNNLLKDEEGRVQPTIKALMGKAPSEEEKKKIWNKFCTNLLKEAMISQQRFTIKEFLWIFGPETFKAILAKLILNIHSDRGSFLGIYHKKNWLSVEGRLKFAHTNQIFTVAHPMDIFFANQITVWQKIIMDKKIKQPFQQVFRALYSLHMDEITENSSYRFSKQQLLSEKAEKAFLEEGFRVKDNYAFYDWKDLHIQSRFIWDQENTRHRGVTVTGVK